MLYILANLLMCKYSFFASIVFDATGILFCDEVIPIGNMDEFWAKMSIQVSKLTKTWIRDTDIPTVGGNASS